MNLASGPEWRTEFGGELCFQCLPSMEWCKCIPPLLNTAVLFKTRNPPGPSHKVTPVTAAAAAAGFRRFAITGWYNEAADRWSEEESAEHAKMRARAS